MITQTCSFLQFGIAPGFRVFQTNPGPSTEITAQLQDGLPWEDATGNAVLTRNGNSLTAAFYESGVVLIGFVFPVATGEYYMNFQVRVPHSYRGSTRGLLGNFDGNPSNEFYRKGETTPLPDGISERELYPHLLTCKTLRMFILYSALYIILYYYACL